MESKRIIAIVEKGPDGLYSVYSDDNIGKSYLGGFGESVSEAKEDFEASIKEAIAEAAEDGFGTIERSDIKVSYHYDIPSLFNYFDFINVSKFAEYAGINESKMRAYKSGSAFPGEKTTGKIRNAIQRIGEEFSSISL